MGRDERHGTKITKYTRVYFPSLPSHPLFYANPNSRPGVVSSLSSPRFEATRRSWNGEQTEHFNCSLVAFMRLVILSKVSPPNLTRYNSRICNSRRRRRVCTPKERGLMPLSPHTCTNL